MTEYLIIFGIEALVIAAAIGVNLLNTSNPALIQMIRPGLWGCFGLPTAMFYLFILYFVRDIIAQYYGKRPDILRSFIAMLTVISVVPLAILEATFPGQGWLLLILGTGFIWSVIFAVVMMSVKRRKSPRSLPPE